MRLLRRHDPQRREAGFDLLRAHAAEHVDDLLAEFEGEPDHSLRCWLLELIGHAESARAVPLLVEQLSSTDESLRALAVAGLSRLDTPAARQALYQARVNGRIT
jgi:HEAT repeat protein